jgi:hypothetical protein
LIAIIIIGINSIAAFEYQEGRMESQNLERREGEQLALRFVSERMCFTFKIGRRS